MKWVNTLNVVQFRSSGLQIGLQKRCSSKFHKFPKKTTALVSLFNKEMKSCLPACDFIKKRLQNRCFSYEICEIFKNNFFSLNTSGGFFWQNMFKVKNKCTTTMLFDIVLVVSLLILNTCWLSANSSAFGC